MYDLTIVGGTIVDGTGAPGVAGGVAVRDGVVVELGPQVDARTEATATIDATGRVVCPGFVDVHTHYDAQLLWDRMMTVSPWHGVTTAIIGNCGFGVAPTRPAHRDLVVRTLEKVEGMSADALRAGLGDEWPFETFPEYLDAVEQRQTAINVGVLAGHTPMRLYVLGEDATEREATPAEVAQMRALLAEALDAGAVGFATSKSPTHVGFDGKPVPSRSATFEEIATIAGALGDAGRGVMQATMGMELAFREFGAIAEATGRPVSWTALLAGVGGPGVWPILLEESDKLVAQGLAVRPQVSCRPLSFEFDLAQPFPLESMHAIAPISAARTVEEKVAIYRDPAFLAELREAMHKGGVLGGSWDRTVVSWFPADPSLEERNVAELADERGVDPTDLAVELSLETGLTTRFRMAVLNYDEDDVEVLLTSPTTMLGLSDAGAHASQLCDAGFSTHLLGHWVRERGAFTMEEAIRKLTSEPAEVFGITDRGLLATGRPADVVVLDPATVGCGELRRVHDQPAGADRLVADASGIDAVVVNGVVIRQDGRDVVDPDGPLPGRLLRGGRAG